MTPEQQAISAMLEELLDSSRDTDDRYRAGLRTALVSVWNLVERGDPNDSGDLSF